MQHTAVEKCVRNALVKLLGSHFNNTTIKNEINKARQPLKRGTVAGIAHVGDHCDAVAALNGNAELLHHFLLVLLDRHIRAHVVCSRLLRQLGNELEELLAYAAMGLKAGSENRTVLMRGLGTVLSSETFGNRVQALRLARLLAVHDSASAPRQVGAGAGVSPLDVYEDLGGVIEMEEKVGPLPVLRVWNTDAVLDVYDRFRSEGPFSTQVTDSVVPSRDLTPFKLRAGTPMVRSAFVAIPFRSGGVR